VQKLAGARYDSRAALIQTSIRCWAEELPVVHRRHASQPGPARL